MVTWPGSAFPDANPTPRNSPKHSSHTALWPPSTAAMNFELVECVWMSSCFCLDCHGPLSGPQEQTWPSGFPISPGQSSSPPAPPPHSCLFMPLTVLCCNDLFFFSTPDTGLREPLGQEPGLLCLTYSQRPEQCPAHSRARKQSVRWVNENCLFKVNKNLLSITINNEGEIFAKYISDKGLISRIDNELLKLNSKKGNSPIRKWAKGMTGHFTREDVWMTDEYRKRCSPSLAMKETQSKAAMSYLYVLIRMPKLQKSDGCWWGCTWIPHASLMGA